MITPMKTVLVVALAALLAATSASAYTLEKTTIHTTADIPVSIAFPDKMEGKIPAVIVLHGTGGVRQREWNYVEKLTSIGIAAIVVDTFTPRGVKDTTANQKAVAAYQMSNDVLKILQTLAQHPKIKGDKIALMGFSKGGGATLRSALAIYNKPDKANFALFIAMYPSCTDYRLDFKTTGRPIRIIMAGNDHWTNPETCVDIAGVQKAQGADISTVTIPTAEHSFDTPGPKHTEVARAENYSQCKFIETSKDVWVESTSKLKVNDEHGLHKDRHKGLRNCITYGVSFGYSIEATAKAWELIKDYLKVIQD